MEKSWHGGAPDPPPKRLRLSPRTLTGHDLIVLARTPLLALSYRVCCKVHIRTPWVVQTREITNKDAQQFVVNGRSGRQGHHHLRWPRPALSLVCQRYSVPAPHALLLCTFCTLGPKGPLAGPGQGRQRRPRLALRTDVRIHAVL